MTLRALELRMAATSALALLPVILVLVWSFEPSIRAMLAVMAFPSSGSELAESNVQEAKRTIQNHFRKYDVYIAVTDIVAILDSYSDDNNQVRDWTESVCGSANLYVWVPLRVRLPLIGDKVTEWCWKPNPLED